MEPLTAAQMCRARDRLESYQHRNSLDSEIAS
jgi:hypothetical protein